MKGLLNKYERRFIWFGASCLFAGNCWQESHCSSHNLDTINKCVIDENNEKDKSQIIFLGTGSSIGSPNPFHLMKPIANKAAQQVSIKAAIGNPLNNKYYRCNPSILIKWNKEKKNILIDMGKTFRESIIRWTPVYRIESIDAVILTHGHADAIFGLDDLRSVQNPNLRLPTPVYLSQECLDVVKKVFFYLFKDNGSSAGTVERLVSAADWKIISNFTPFKVFELELLPIPVMHGEDMESMAFLFGSADKVCYISDISHMPQQSLDKILEYGPITLLVVDCLSIYEHPTHYSLSQAVELAKIIKAKKTLLIGMSSSVDHEIQNEKLKELNVTDGLNIQLAYDGMAIDINL